MYDVENLYLNPVVFSANDGIFIFCYTVTYLIKTTQSLVYKPFLFFGGKGGSCPYLLRLR